MSHLTCIEHLIKNNKIERQRCSTEHLEDCEIERPLEDPTGIGSDFPPREGKIESRGDKKQKHSLQRKSSVLSSPPMSGSIRAGVYHPLAAFIVGLASISDCLLKDIFVEAKNNSRTNMK